LHCEQFWTQGNSEARNGRQKKQIEWEVVKEHVLTEENETYRDYIGLTSVDLSSIDDKFIFAWVFLHLFCKDIDEMTAQVTVTIAVYNHQKRFSLGKIKHFSASEIIVGFALIIGVGAVGGKWCMMWYSERKQREKFFCDSILKEPDFEELGMPYWWFEKFHKCSPAMWEKKEIEVIYEWWQAISMNDEFNGWCKKFISASHEKTVNEAMGAMRQRTTKLGGWPHISYILHAQAWAPWHGLQEDMMCHHRSSRD
jgi:hypothetical protein